MARSSTAALARRRRFLSGYTGNSLVPAGIPGYFVGSRSPIGLAPAFDLTLAAITHASTPADALPLGWDTLSNYVTTEPGAAINSATVAYLIAGTPVAGTYDLAGGERVQIEVTVGDDAGNSRKFVRYALVPPVFTVQPSASPSPATVGQTVTLTGGTAPNAVLTIEYLTLDGVDDTENLIPAA